MPIRIRCSINGFRRAGVAHSTEPRVYPDDFFTPEQLRQLEGEPRITLDRVEPLAPAPGGSGVRGTVEPGPLTPGEGENGLQPLVDLIAQLSETTPELWNDDGTPKASNFPEGTSDIDIANAWSLFTTGSLAVAGDNAGSTETLADLTVAELRDMAKNLDIDGYGTMKKAALIAAIEAVKANRGADQ